MSHTRTNQTPLLTVREVAGILRVSPRWFTNWSRRGKLACHRIGNRNGAIRISAADVDDYLARCRNERRDETPKPPRPRLKHLKL